MFRWEAWEGGGLVLGAGDGTGKVASDGWTGGLHELIIIEEERDVAGALPSTPRT